MSSDCSHLIIARNKIVKPNAETYELNFLCALKREDSDIAKTLNDAFQKQTQISVAGYTCYYHTSKNVICSQCPKFEASKTVQLQVPAL